MKLKKIFITSTFAAIVGSIAACGSTEDDKSNALEDDAILDSRVEIFYTFDETADGKAKNSSFDAFHGDIIGANRADGKVNGALYFGNTNSGYVKFPMYEGDSDAEVEEFKIDFPSNEMSIEAWVKFETLDTSITYPFFGNLEGCCIERFIYDIIDGQFRFRITPTLNGLADTELLRSDFTFGVDTWYHIALTYDGQGAKLFINGELNTQNNVVYTIYRYVGEMTLAGGEDQDSFPGYIDEFKFSMNSRTEAEINAYYNATKEL